ncbi:MAG: hypothetical protein ACKVON_04340 [Beijerinckiaceae bacterium]
MTDTANTATIATGLAALDRYSEHLEAAMGPTSEISNILELRDIFAISGLQSQDFVLFSVAEIIRKVLGWPDKRLGKLDCPALQQAAAGLTRCLETALCA